MKKLLSILLICTVFISCEKDDVPFDPAPGQPMDDRRSVLIKDIMAEKLPNPYYNFKYDTAKYVTEVSFASNLSVYKVEYENKRVKKLKNIKNGHNILYTYTENLVTKIDEYNLGNLHVYSYELSYNASGRLAQITWKEFFDDPSGIVIKKVVFSYQPDGNLYKLETYLVESGVLTLSSTRKYSDYDDKTNVDDFYVMMDFFDTFLFLPQVKLQLNNPRKELINGGLNEFDITYTYEFNNNLPIRKIIDLHQTKGDHAGQKGHFINQFTYY